ncbi:MAG: heavy-metal-associated domain-containing protein [Patescibacteria group bacterium]|jgi:copper chaperone CopZ
MIKKTYKLSGLHCTACSLLIEGEIEDLGAKADCNYADQEVKVEYDPKKIAEGKIIEAIEKQGYEVVG